MMIPLAPGSLPAAKAATIARESRGDAPPSASPGNCQGRAVAPRVGEEQHDVIHVTVARLEADPSHRCLSVPKPRLGLDPRTPSPASDHPRPGAPVPGGRDRDLGAPTQGG